MKILSTTSFIVLVGLLLCLIQTTLSRRCIEYLNPLNRYENKIVDCPMVSFMDKRQTQSKSDKMFDVEFHCSIADTELCES